MRCPPIVITPKIVSVAEARTAPTPPPRDFPSGSVSEAVSMVLAGRETVAAAARITGSSPVSVEALAWETTKRLVHERDAGCCTSCLAAGTAVHHRVRRDRGFTADPVIAFGLANTTLVCGPCHRKSHDLANPEMAARGYRLAAGQSPEAEPLLLFSDGAPGVKVWLTPEGEYSTVRPEVGLRT